MKSNPFKFLNPYTSRDKERFFGREREAEELYEKLKQTNLLLVYGFIGTGKTSLVRCGLSLKVREEEWLPLIIHRQDHILRSFRKKLVSQLKNSNLDQSDIPQLIEEIYYEHLAPLYLIFDQFEELLILGSEEERQSFFDLINKLINSRLKIKVILVFREEYKAYLDKYECTVGRLFHYCYRLEPMRRNTVQETIVRICNKENITLAPGIPQNIIKLLSDRGQYKVIKLTYLQVLFFQLYNLAREKEYDPVRFDDDLILAAGDFSTILSRLLHQQIETLGKESAGPKGVRYFLKEFVTIEGTKKPVCLETLVNNLGGLFLTRKQIQQFLEFFVNSQILRLVEDNKYELVHDTIAAEISKMHIQRPLKNPEILENPYKGLQPFSQVDDRLFYGRKKVLEELHKKILAQPLVVLVGDTGSGKSSLVRAGVLPLLEKDGFFLFDVIRPGLDPLSQLEEKVIRHLKDLAPSQRAVIVVDQAEELITRTEKKEDGATFIEKLWDLAQGRAFKVILTLRIDFEARVARLYLKDLWKNARFPVPVPTYHEYVEIIEQPAFKAGCYFEPDTLIDEIAQEAGTVTIALPLLSFCLNRLYVECEPTKVFTREAYQKIGGVVGAISCFADELFQGLNPGQQQGMKRLMIRMVSLKGSELAARRVRLEELKCDNQQEQEIVREVMDILLEPGLIVRGRSTGGSEFVEPAHDALLWGWDRLQDWIEEIGKDKILLRDRLQVAVKEWSDNGQNEEFLWYNDPALDQAEALNWLNERERVFVSKSITQKRLEKRKKNTNKTIFLFILALIPILILSNWYAIEKKKEQEARKLADQKDAMIYKLATGALNVEKFDRTLAFQLAQAVIESNDKNVLARYLYNNFAKDILTHPTYWKVLNSEQGGITDLDISPDNNYFITGGADGSLSLRRWEKDSIRRDWNIKLHKGRITKVLISPDNTEILTGAEDGFIHLIEAVHGNLIATYQNNDQITSLDFSEDQKKILSGGNDGRIKVWRKSRSSSPVSRRNWHQDKVVGAFFFGKQDSLLLSGGRSDLISLKNYLSGDTSWFYRYSGQADRLSALNGYRERSIIVAGFEDGFLKIWQKKDNLWGEPVTLKAHEASVTKISFSDGGEHILTTSLDKTAKMWDLQGNLLKTFLGHHDELLTADITSSRYFDQKKIVTAGEDQTLKLWKLANREQFLLYEQKSRKVPSVGFYPDSLRDSSGTFHIYGGDSKGFGFFWDTDGSDFRKPLKFGAPLNEVCISPDTAYLIMVGDRPFAHLYDLRKARFQENPLRLGEMGKGDSILAACFTPDSKYVFVAYSQGQIVGWDIKGKHQFTIPAHRGTKVADIDISHDGQWLLSAGYDHTAKLWKINKTPEGIGIEWMETMDAHTDKVECVVFAPDSLYFLTGSWDNTFKLWTINQNTPTQVRTFTGHTFDIQALDFSPDGKTILSASKDKTVKLWGRDGQEKLSYIKLKDEVLDARFSPDGKYIVTGGKDGTVKLWSADMEQEILKEIPSLPSGEWEDPEIDP